MPSVLRRFALPGARWLPVLLALLGLPLHAQPARLAADLRTEQPVAFPEAYAVLGETLYFTEGFSLAGGVWRTQGSLAEPALGPAYGRCEAPAVYENAVYFVCRDHLVRLQPEAAPVAFPLPWAPPAQVRFARPFNGALYVATSPIGQAASELWRFDGAAFARVGSVPRVGTEAVVFQNALYFAGAGGEAGTDVELWAFDGQQVGLRLDLNPGGSSYPTAFAVYAGALYFRAEDAQHGAELRRFDGTQATLVADLEPGAAGSFVDGLAVIDGKLWFSASPIRAGQGLWAYDGSAPRLEVAASAGGLRYLGTPAALGGRLYFGASDAQDVGDLWTHTDGATRRATTTSVTPYLSSPAVVAQTDTRLYFVKRSGDDPTPQLRLWAFDGQEAAPVTHTAPQASSTPAAFAAFGGTLLFAATGDGNAGREVWAYADGAAHLAVDATPGPAGSLPERLTPAEGYVALTLTTPEHGAEPWVYDGADVRLAVDVRPGPTGSMPRAYASAGATVLFTADDGAYGRQVWRFDGRAARRLTDAPSRTEIQAATRFGGALFVIAVDTATTLRRYDPAADALHPLASIGARGPHYLFEHDGALHLLSGGLLQRFDGPSATRVADVSGYVRGVVTAQGRVYAWGDAFLSVLDGHAFTPVAPGAYVLAATPYRDGLAFLTSTADGPELWVYDGARTTRAHAFDRLDRVGREMIAHGDALFFAAATADAGMELWTYDGPVTTGTHARARPVRAAVRVAPTPTAGLTTVHLALPPSRTPGGSVQVTVYDAFGRLVARLHDGPASGALALPFDAGSLAAGLYFVRVTGDAHRETVPFLVTP